MEFYGELRVDNGLRKIGVNDEGDYIEVSVNDSTIFDRFADMLSWITRKEADIDRISEEYGKKLAEVSADAEDGDADRLPVHHVDIISEVVKMRTDLYREVCQRLDILFGEGCCRKVFGSNIVPDDLLIMDFLEQITPIIEKLGKERNKKLSLKYNRNRRGANSNSFKALPGKGV